MRVSTFAEAVTLALAAVACWSVAASAMGYDSLTCGELAERRIAYFNESGFCAPGEKPEVQAKNAGRECAVAPEGIAALPAAERQQVEMIVKVEARKGCGRP